MVYVTIQDREKKAEKKAAMLKELDIALKYCRETGCHGKKAVSTKSLKLVTPKQIDDRLKGKVSINGNSHLRILTVTETKEFADWLKSCNANHKPRDRVQQAEKICEILRHRQK